MKVLKANSKLAIPSAIEVLKKGGLVIFPTETCYGVAVDAANKTAINKLLSFKGSRNGKAISIAASGQQMASRYVSLNSLAKNIYRELLPGPFTVISRSRHLTDSRLESNGTLGIRIPDHELPLTLTKTFGRAVTATSANSSGRKPPYSLLDFRKYNTLKTISLTDLFLDAGTLPRRLPSTIIDTTLQEPKILRQGEININSNPVITRSEIATQRYAYSLFGQILKKTNLPLVVALQGDLGSGKTQFAKGVAKFLRIKSLLTSPTYTILKEYPYSRGTLYHLDTWRVNASDIDLLNLPSLLTNGNVLIIEWVQKAKILLTKLEKSHPILWVNLQPTGLVSRAITHKLTLPSSH